MFDLVTRRLPALTATAVANMLSGSGLFGPNRWAPRPARPLSTDVHYAPADVAPFEVLDHAQLAELRAVLGPTRIAQLLTLFTRELAARPAAIRAAIGRSDLHAAASQAHSLKGAAVSIGGRMVGRAAEALELVLSRTAPQQAERLLAALRDLDSAVAATIAAVPAELALEAPQAA